MERWMRGIDFRALADEAIDLESMYPSMPYRIGIVSRRNTKGLSDKQLKVVKSLVSRELRMRGQYVKIKAETKISVTDSQQQFGFME